MTTCDWHGLQCLSNASDLLDSVKAAMLGLSNFDQKKIRQIDSGGLHLFKFLAVRSCDLGTAK